MTQPASIARRPSPRHRAVLALTLLLATSAQAQRIDVLPAADVLVGEAPQIVLIGVPTNSEVSLQALRQVVEFTGGQRPYSAQARFKADEQGRVDLATQAPLSGTYSGADVRGLFWSMLPNKDAAQAASQTASQAASEATSQSASQTAATPPLRTVVLQARLADSTLLAEQIVQLRPSSPAVLQRKADPFAGAVFASLPGTQKGPRWSCWAAVKAVP